MKIGKGIFVPIVLLLLAACGSSASTSSTEGKSATTIDTSLVASWRILTETIYFDNGLTSKDAKVVPVTTLLALDASGAWTFGSSTGTWSVATIADTDWTEWAVTAYGPTRKLVLTGWNDGTGKGPIDEPTGVIDNIWVIYKYTSDTNGPGTVWLKFGQ